MVIPAAAIRPNDPLALTQAGFLVPNASLMLFETNTLEILLAGACKQGNEALH